MKDKKSASGIKSLIAKKKLHPLGEGAGGRVGVGGRFLVFGFGIFGIVRKIDHLFAGQFFIMKMASGELLVFRRRVVDVFKSNGFGFELKQGFGFFGGSQALSEFPVARHGGDGIAGKKQASANGEK